MKWKYLPSVYDAKCLRDNPKRDLAKPLKEDAREGYLTKKLLPASVTLGFLKKLLEDCFFVRN